MCRLVDSDYIKWEKYLCAAFGDNEARNRETANYKTKNYRYEQQNQRARVVVP